jgi:hypothetical protein
MTSPMTAQHLRLAARQMKLAPSGIDAHVGVDTIS